MAAGAGSTTPADPHPVADEPDEGRTPSRAFDDVHAAFYTVGQVAEMLSVQPAFLRRLDAEAVVQPARSVGGQRRYSRVEISLIEKVVELVGEGLTLAGIRRLLVLEDQVRDLQRQLDGQEVGAGPELGSSDS